MKNFKRMLALLLTVCMVLSLAPAAFAEDAPVLANEDEVIVYYTNDVHTYIDKPLSYDNIADLKNQTAEQAAGVLLVDAGDHVQGTAYGSMDKGDTIIELMNAAGYDLATLGNHEFDYGMEKALANVEAAEFPYISANFYHEYKNPFTDVPAGKWYTEHVAHMNQWGIINGMTATTFGPMNTLTRAQFATMMYRAAKEPDVSELTHPFTDVPEGKYYTDAVKFLSNYGIINGITDTLFAPNDPITREMMVTILWRAAGKPQVECDLSAFEDLGIVSDYAMSAMQWAVHYEIINGMSATKLGPKTQTNRAMAAKVLDICFYGVPKYDTVLPAYEIKEIGGMRIAFVGVTTPESFTKSTPAYFQDENGNYIYGIAGGADGQALYDAVQIVLQDLILYNDVDYIVGLGHLGDDPASQPWTSEELIANTVGFDAFIDGHSHSTVASKEVLDADGDPVILTQTGEYFGAIGKMTISEDGIATELITEWTGSDEAVAAIKNEWITEIDEMLGEVIGHTDIVFDNYDETGRLVRKMETNTGDFAADALYYLFDNMGLDVDVAIMNGGGVRNKAITGDISYKTCKEIHTFGNVACLQTITGQQLLDALEWGAKDVGTAENGGFLHVSGITYEIHPYIPSTVQKDSVGVWTGGPTGEYRVKNVKILQDGEYVDLDLEAKYNLAGYNYTLRDLGDGFAMFGGAVNVLDYVMEDYMVLANYIKSFPVDEETGLPTITAENSPYESVYGEGRITSVIPATSDEIVIYYTNDVHTYIDNDISYDTIADLKNATAKCAAGVLLMDAGDHIQGTAYGSMDKGKTIIDLMNAAGYDVATLGNHEFDYGMDGTMNVIDWAEYPYVSANFYHEENGVAGETVLDAYKVFEVAGTKIAVIGITTPESFTKSTPAYFQDENGNYIYGIAGGEDGKALYAAVQNAIDAASAEADVVIALAHLGDDPASQPWTSEELIANTTGLDALIDGHSHSTVPMKEVQDAAGNTVVLTQTGEYFGAIGRMSITAEGIQTSLVTEWTGSDDAVAAIKNEWMTKIDEQLGEVIGHAEVTFDNYDETGRLVRKMETNTGDFAADALYHLFNNMGLDVDVAIMNGGGVRNKTITGDISYKTCKEIHTFGNVACLQTITGQQLLDALEWGARDAGTDKECGGFLHVSGITYEIDTTVTSTVQKDEKGVWIGGPTGEYRVKNVKILQDGEYVDLDLEAKYNLAGYNYTLRDLGDGFAMFGGAVNVLDYVMEDYMVLANYVKSFPVDEETGLPTITAENSPYESIYGEGRITLLK